MIKSRSQEARILNPAWLLTRSDLWRDALTLWSTVSLSITQRGWTRCSAMPPLQLSVSLKVSYLHHSNSDQMPDLATVQRKGLSTCRAIKGASLWELDPWGIRRNLISGGRKRAYKNGMHSKSMHRLRKEHRMFLKQTCLISLTVWGGNLSEQTAHVP